MYAKWFRYELSFQNHYILDYKKKNIHSNIIDDTNNGIINKKYFRNENSKLKNRAI